MPTTHEIPSHRVRYCKPCEYLKSNGGMRGGPGNVWDWWCCMHPKANDDSPLSNDPKIRDKQIELRTRMAEHGRSIEKSAFAKQPSWCPLKREPDMDRDTARILAGDSNTWEVWIRRAGSADFHYTKTFNDRKEARKWCDASGLQMDE